MSPSGYGTSNQRGNGDGRNQRQRELPDSEDLFVVSASGCGTSNQNGNRDGRIENKDKESYLILRIRWWCRRVGR